MLGCVRSANKVMFCLRPPSPPRRTSSPPRRREIALLIKAGGIFLIDFWLPVDKSLCPAAGSPARSSSRLQGGQRPSGLQGGRGGCPGLKSPRFSEHSEAACFGKTNGPSECIKSVDKHEKRPVSLPLGAQCPQCYLLGLKSVRAGGGEPQFLPLRPPGAGQCPSQAPVLSPRPGHEHGLGPLLPSGVFGGAAGTLLEVGGMGLGSRLSGLLLVPCSVPLAQPPRRAQVSSTLCWRGQSASHPAAPLPQPSEGRAEVTGGRCDVSKGQTLAR